MIFFFGLKKSSFIVRFLFFPHKTDHSMIQKYLQNSTNKYWFSLRALAKLLMWRTITSFSSSISVVFSFFGASSVSPSSVSPGVSSFDVSCVSVCLSASVSSAWMLEAPSSRPSRAMDKSVCVLMSAFLCCSGTSTQGMDTYDTCVTETVSTFMCLRWRVCVEILLAFLLIQSDVLPVGTFSSLNQ